MEKTGRFSVRFVNHGYSADETFESVTQAIAFAKRTGFDAAIEVDGRLVAAWDVIGGTKFYTEEAREACAPPAAAKMTCECERPEIDVERDAACRRCGREVDFTVVEAMGEPKIAEAIAAERGTATAAEENAAAKAVGAAQRAAKRPKKERPKSRATRWAEAVADAQSALDDARERIEAAFEELRGIQEEYQEWRDNLDGRFEGSALVEKLETITEIDLDPSSALDEVEQMIGEADGAECPMGFGRD